MNPFELSKEKIIKIFKSSPERKTMTMPKNYEVFQEHDSVFLRVEDIYYDCNDSESLRTFTVNDAMINYKDTLSFEEI